jgi:protoheme ferro-lyase
MIMSFIMRNVITLRAVGGDRFEQVCQQSRRPQTEEAMAEDPIKLFSSRADRYPEPTEADVALGAGRAALAAIPVIGGTLTEVLSLVLAPAVARRRDTWFRELADALEEAERKIEGFTIENLAEDELFVSAVIEATRSAVSTHKDEKREALKNGLLNIACTGPPMRTSSRPSSGTSTT